jgi:tRNA G46 methylase TrmB
MQQSALRDRGSNFLGVELRPDLVEIANAWSRARCPARNLHFVSGNINACIASLTAALPSCNGVARVSIQFPDPWSRRRHRRRRIVQPELAQALHSCMRVGGEVYVSSDVENILDDARRAFLADDLFRLCGANEASTRVPDARPALESNDVESDSDSEADVEYQEETVADAPSSAYDDSPLDPAVQGSAAQSMQLVPTDANGYLTISPLLVLSEREKVCETLWRRVYRLVFVKL